MLDEFREQAEPDLAPFPGRTGMERNASWPNGQRQRAVRASPPSSPPHLLFDSMIPSKLSAGSCMQEVVVSWFRSNLSPLGAGQTSPPEVNYTYTQILPNQTCWPPLHGHG